MDKSEGDGGRSRSQQIGRIILLFSMVYLLFDFSFLIAGRVAEPTIYRVMALTIMIYIGAFSIASELSSKRYFSMLLGFISLAAVLYVYIYNVFIFAAMAMTVFIWAYQTGLKNTLKQCLYFLLGSILCLITYQIYIDLVYGSNLVEVYKSVAPYQSRLGSGLSKSGLLKSYLINTMMIFMTNIFRFNPVLLFMFLVSLPVFFQKVIVEKRHFDIMIANLLAFLLLQSLFINDFALRKLLVMLPLVIIVIIMAYQYADSYWEGIRNSHKGKKVVWIYWALVWGLTLSVSQVYMNNLGGYSTFSSGYWKGLSLAGFIFVSVTIILKYLFSIRIRRMVAMVCLAIILVPNLFFDTLYVFWEPTYYYRDLMIDMKDKVDGKTIVGGCAYAFRLYNDSIPVLDFYSTLYGASPDEVSLYHTNFDQLFSQGIGSYSIAYTADIPDSVLGANYMLQHHLALEEEYSFNAIAGNNIGLFAPTVELQR